MIEHVSHPILEVHDLTVSYQNKPVLWNIDFTIPKGALVGIMGPNGAGKSTLIKSIMGLLPNKSGYIKIADQSFNHIRDKVSYVPQRESVDWNFPASVFDVVMMGRYGRLGLFKRPRKADKEAVMNCLRDLGIASLKDRQISALSGGQQQRVFLARALAQNADIYFMDEPFAGVDASTEAAVMKLLKQMQQNGKTVIVVHHDLQTAPSYFSWIILLNQRLVASAPLKKAYTTALLQETYGGQLTLLNEVSQLVENKGYPIRND